jgi:hypothetical protein
MIIFDPDSAEKFVGTLSIRADVHDPPLRTGVIASDPFPVKAMLLESVVYDSISPVPQFAEAPG